MKYIIWLIAFFTAACTYEHNFYPVEEDNSVMTTKRTKDGWQAAGQLSQQDSTKQFSLQADFPESGSYTVEFSIEQALTSTAPRGQLRGLTYAEIVWSVEGNDVRRTVAVYNGLSVTGVAQAVKITLYDASTTGAGRLYNASMVVAKGTRASTENPPIYEVGPNAASPLGPIWVVAAGATQDVPVPLNIGVKSVGIVVANQSLTPIPDQGVQVEQRNGGGIRKYYDPRQVYWVPLSPGVDTIRLRNNLPGPDPADRVVFAISWGVDG